MYEIAGLDKLIYDKKCRLVWNFVAANEIFILLFIIIIYLSLKYFFLKFSYQNSKYHWMELFYDIIFFIYFCLSFFLSNLNLILWKFNEWLSSGLFKYSIYL